MSVIIPEEFLQEVHMTSNEMRQEIAVALYERGTLSLNQASKLLRLSLQDFQLLVIPPSQKISMSNITVELNESNIRLSEWLESYKNEPDDKDEEWWDEFEEELRQNRKNFKFRDIEL